MPSDIVKLAAAALMESNHFDTMLLLDGIARRPSPLGYAACQLFPGHDAPLRLRRLPRSCVAGVLFRRVPMQVV